jgi:competence CoiA-like predicted nuclease
VSATNGNSLHSLVMPARLQEHRDLILAGLKARTENYVLDGEYIDWILIESLLEKHGKTINDAKSAATAFLSRNPTYGTGLHTWHEKEREYERNYFGHNNSITGNGKQEGNL